MEVRQLRPDEVDSYRELRLRALREAPYAFNTTYEQAAARPHSVWLELMGRFANGRDSAVFVLDRGDAQLSGLVCVRSGSPERSATIPQMWLDPALRGQGRAVRESARRRCTALAPGASCAAASQGGHERRGWVASRPGRWTGSELRNRAMNRSIRQRAAGGNARPDR